MLRSDLCDYNEAYIVVKGGISFRGTNYANRITKMLTFTMQKTLVLLCRSIIC